VLPDVAEENAQVSIIDIVSKIIVFKTISIQPFYLHQISVLRPFECFLLGVCAFIIPPLHARGRKWLFKHWKLIAYIAIILVSVNGIALTFRVLARKTIEEGRTVFAYTNYDISPASFVVQHIQFIISFGLIAIIWVQWLSYAITRYIEVIGEKQGRVDQFAMARLSFTMLHWQCVCALISISFLFYTVLEWRQIVSNKQRLSLRVRNNNCPFNVDNHDINCQRYPRDHMGLLGII
jgi:hypothetical protein